MRLSTAVLSATVLATPAWSWTDKGHKITATIAQIHLLPSAEQAICNILPKNYSCSLASVASWPDEIKKESKWRRSGNWHFVNGKEDNPPEKCTFGEAGWQQPWDNILYGIVNTTRELNSTTGEKQDIALRFLTHYLGDVHQPLHLAGKDVGGNMVPVKYGENRTNLHLVWDEFLIAQRLRLMANYTTPLPTSSSPTLPPSALALNQRIESALNGSIYDPLVRWIVLEGIHGWWADQHHDWTVCPQLGLRQMQGQQVMQTLPFNDPIDLPVCPYHWSAPAHQMLCDFIWRPDFVGVKNMTTAEYKIQLETPEYAGRIREEKIVEKQLALGGMRLAAILNSVLGSQEEKRAFGVLPKLI